MKYINAQQIRAKQISLSRKLELELEFLTNLSLAMKEDGNQEKEEKTENCEHREAKT